MSAADCGLAGEGRVEISGGTITTVDGEAAPYPIWIFFLEVVEPWGGRMIMWSGTSYDAAIMEAEGLRRDGWGEIVDVVVGSEGRGVVPNFGPSKGTGGGRQAQDLR